MRSVVLRLSLSVVLCSWGLSVLSACSDSADPAGGPNGRPTDVPPGSDGGGGSDVDFFDTGTELRVPVPASGRAFVKLANPSVVSVTRAPASSLDWDLAFEGFDVVTNSGVSGQGTGGAFGPLDAATFLGSDAPTVPFISADKAGGAFLDWYAYDETTHALWSRYHVYGVKDADRLFKVQVINYYGERDGAPVAALYKLRYAELFADGTSGAVVDLTGVDGTAGGAQAPETAPSDCLNLGSGRRSMLTPAEAAASTDWSLCFRRSNVGVNGEMGGPRGTIAVDLSASETASETVAQVMARTDVSERARFEAVTHASFDGQVFRGDRIVSVFGEAWLDRSVAPVAPAYATWLVVDASGQQKFLVGFRSFESPTTTSPGTVVMKIKPVRG